MWVVIQRSTLMFVFKCSTQYPPQKYILKKIILDFTQNIVNKLLIRHSYFINLVNEHKIIKASSIITMEWYIFLVKSKILNIHIYKFAIHDLWVNHYVSLYKFKNEKWHNADVKHKIWQTCTISTKHTTRRFLNFSKWHNLTYNPHIKHVMITLKILI